jgi:hypothetical protein
MHGHATAVYIDFGHVLYVAFEHFCVSFWLNLIARLEGLRLCSTWYADESVCEVTRHAWSTMHIHLLNK